MVKENVANKGRGLLLLLLLSLRVSFVESQNTSKNVRTIRWAEPLFGPFQRVE
jgi:hypothetical protein